jgi:hypothetical protein
VTPYKDCLNNLAKLLLPRASEKRAETAAAVGWDGVAERPACTALKNVRMERSRKPKTNLTVIQLTDARCNRRLRHEGQRQSILMNSEYTGALR